MLFLLSNKGQTSFEVMLIAGFIILLSFLILNYWSDVSETTKALAIAKQSTLSVLQEHDDFFFLQKIDYKVSGNELDLTIVLTPERDSEISESEFQVVADTVSKNTGYSAVNIEVEYV